MFTRADLYAHGWSDGAISRAVRSGRLLRLRQGLYTAGPANLTLTAIAAAYACRGAAVSHRSALRDHDLPLVGSPPRLPEVTVAPGGTGSLEGALLHRATLPPGHVIRIGDHDTTTVARTLVDVARSRPIITAVAAMDAALHRGLVTLDDIEDVMLFCWNWPGIGRAHRALRHVDGRAESPLESVSRLVIGWLGLPPPQPQCLVIDDRGVVIARLDFYWDESGIAGEADGRSKYDDRSVLTAEKERQEAIEDLGLPVVRWQWWHTTHPQQLRSKLERAFERGRARDRSALRRGWSVRAS